MRKKLFIAFASVLILEVLISFLFSVQEIKKAYEKEVKEELLNHGGLIDAFLLEVKASPKDYQHYADLLSAHTQSRITFIQKDGIVLADSDAEASSLENHKEREEIQKALLGQIGTAKRQSSSISKHLFYLAYPSGHEEIKVVRLAKPIKEIAESAKSIYAVIFSALGIGLIASFILSFFLIKRINRPIQALSDTSMAIQKGEYGKVIATPSDDELGLLTRHFNQMSLSLKENFEKNRDENIKSKAILSSMSSGLIAFDEHEKIIAVNKAAETLFDIQESALLYQEKESIFEHKKISKPLYDCIKNFTPDANLEIHFGRKKILSVRFNKIYAHDGKKITGTLMIAEDVTEIRRLERIRKDFVANVSHEIGTPLTSIKGFAETLKEEALPKDQQNRFLDIILLESDRLRALTKDLLSLSDIENMDQQMPLEPIHTQRRIENCLEMLEPLAEQKEIQFLKELKTPLPNLKGKALWFDQIIINLIDNAIKYTPSLGTVTASFYESQGCLFIRVSDTGIGIPKESLDRIFERFYRVDKARSRKAGGTGLGLAIVKHIVIAFSGHIHVESELGKGTTFTVSLPL